jgi:hypothetical protein
VHREYGAPVEPLEVETVHLRRGQADVFQFESQRTKSRGEVAVSAKEIENRRYSVPGAGMEQRDRVPREPHGNLLEEVIEERFPREEMQKRFRSISFSFLPTRNAALSHL